MVSMTTTVFLRSSQRLLVTLDPRPRLLSSGIMVLPWREFCARLWAGEVL